MQGTASPSRTTVLELAAALIVAAVLLAVAAGPIAVGDATTHAREHGTVAAVTAAILAFVGLTIRPPDSGPVLSVWRAVLVAFAFLAAVQLIEGVGGMGYGPSNEGTRYSWLVTVHLVGVLATFVGYVAVLVSLLAAGAWLLRRAVGSLRSS